jgi:Phage integrase family
MDELARPVPKKRIPVVLTRPEVQALLSQLDGQHKLLASLLYGCGMRLMEGLRLRIKDVDFDRKLIIVREPKGGKDRVVMLSSSLLEPLKNQCRLSHDLWAQDRAAQVPGVEMPYALDCDAFAASGHGYPHGAGIAGAFGCVHHDDLHPCVESGGGWDGEPAGCFGGIGVSMLNER